MRIRSDRCKKVERIIAQLAVGALLFLWVNLIFYCFSDEAAITSREFAKRLDQHKSLLRAIISP